MLVVSLTPLLNQHSGLHQAAEDLCVQALSAEGAVEAFVASVLPRFSWINIGQLDVLSLQLLAKHRRHQLSAVVAADRPRPAEPNDQLTEKRFDIRALDTPSGMDGQAKTRRFVFHG